MKSLKIGTMAVFASTGFMTLSVDAASAGSCEAPTTPVELKGVPGGGVSTTAHTAAFSFGDRTGSEARYRLDIYHSGVLVRTVHSDGSLNKTKKLRRGTSPIYKINNLMPDTSYEFHIIAERNDPDKLFMQEKHDNDAYDDGNVHLINSRYYVCGRYTANPLAYLSNDGLGSVDSAPLVLNVTTKPEQNYDDDRDENQW